jgi:hypothetical protein
MTQSELSRRVGVGQSRMSEIEGGHGASAALELWVALGMALEQPLAVSLSRDITVEPADAGHLAIQELVVRLARECSRTATFELPTHATNPARSIDIGIRDDRHRVLIAVEIWNRLDDVGAAMRAHDRKVAEAAALAVAVGDGDPYRVAIFWILRDTAANRQLVERYPAILGSRFPGSSLGWARALAAGGEVPTDPGMLWASADARRLVPLRRHRSTQGPSLRNCS